MWRGVKKELTTMRTECEKLNQQREVKKGGGKIILTHATIKWFDICLLGVVLANATIHHNIWQKLALVVTSFAFIVVV